MDDSNVVKIIKRKFAATGSPSQGVPLLRGSGSFTARLKPDGVLVSNLGTQPFLPWAVFEEAISVIVRHGGKAKRGNAMNCKLGEPGLPLNSVEGHIAYVVYGKRQGDTVFRRITPVACLLIWAGLCQPAPGELILL